MEDNKFVSAIVIIVTLIVITLVWRRVPEAPEAPVLAVPTAPAVFTEGLAAPAPSPAAVVTVDPRTLEMLKRSLPVEASPPKLAGPNVVFPTEDEPGMADPPSVTRYPGSRLLGTQESIGPAEMAADYLAKASPEEVRSFYVDLYRGGWKANEDGSEPDGSAWWGHFSAPDGQSAVGIMALSIADTHKSTDVEPVSYIKVVILPAVPDDTQGGGP